METARPPWQAIFYKFFPLAELNHQELSFLSSLRHVLDRGEDENAEQIQIEYEFTPVFKIHTTLPIFVERAGLNRIAVSPFDDEFPLHTYALWWKTFHHPAKLMGEWYSAIQFTHIPPHEDLKITHIGTAYTLFEAAFKLYINQMSSLRHNREVRRRIYALSEANQVLQYIPHFQAASH